MENARRQGSDEPPLAKSDSDFIVHASGVRTRHVIEREGILDPTRMAPRIPVRPDDALSLEAEFGIASARKALDHAGLKPSDVDLVICSASHHQRPYPAIAIEMQEAWAPRAPASTWDLAALPRRPPLHMAVNLVRSGAHKRILVTTPEIITGISISAIGRPISSSAMPPVSMLVEGLAQGDNGRGVSRCWTHAS
ncbi:hypothetical protein ACFSQT_37600 [Mesorhizobium calcicola]|uniref:Uncharacterized protein n=1 Tax=Mesorhizobium calcicola TaxID=1300310 RepID=A0ABW4WQA8_9HYPH